MRVGQHVVYLSGSEAYSGVLTRSVYFGGETRWAIAWDDGVVTPETTWGEPYLRVLVPQ